MRIVLLNQFFWPDLVATSQMLTDMARVLAKDHEVVAICSKTNSAEVDSDQRPEVTIVHVRGMAFGRSKPARLASYLLFMTGAMRHGIRLQHQDAYITLTTPPMLPVIGSVFARFRRIRHVIWEMDIYPDIATDIGYFKKDGIIDRLFGCALDWSRRRAAAIIVLGEDMKARLVARGIAESKIHIAENWADGVEITPTLFPEGPLVIHYSGNLGLAHETATITTIIGRLRNHSSFRFVFAGGGPQRPALEHFCQSEGIHNVEFRPYCPRAELGRSLAEGHIGLVTQIPETVGSIVPSKIYGIMAAGRPLLYVGPQESTPARHIREFDCGWRIEPGDAVGTIRLLHHLELNRHLISEAGARGRIAFEKHYDRPIGITRILKIVQGATATPGSRVAS